MVIERDRNWYDRYAPTREYSELEFSSDPTEWTPFSLPHQPEGRDWTASRRVHVYMDDETGLLVADRERFEKWIAGL